MLQYFLKEDGFLFTAKTNGRDIPFKEWSVGDDCIYYFPLATLVDNGYASCHGDGCLVPYENIYLLDEGEQRLLGVPNPYNQGMRLRAEGLLNSSDLVYKLELLTSVPDGDLISYRVQGNVLRTQNGDYLLKEGEYKLFQQVEQYNKTPEADKTADYNFRCFASIKEQSLEVGCFLDSYLENENVFVPEQLKLEVGQDADGFYVKPSAEMNEKEGFERAFERSRRVMGVYPVQKENGERVRVVLNAEQKQGLEYLKQRKCHFTSRDEVRKMVENPTEYFDPDKFDLKEFYSDRVAKNGAYPPTQNGHTRSLFEWSLSRQQFHVANIVIFCEESHLLVQNVLQYAQFCLK